MSNTVIQSHDINADISADNINQVNYPRYKFVTGDVGTAVDVGPSNPVPVGVKTGTFVTVAFDYMAYTSGSVTDVYVYKTGGSGGTTVATVTVTWTNSSKDVLVSVART